MHSPAGNYIPQTTSIRRSVVFWMVGASVSLFVLLLTIAAPLAASMDHPVVARTIYQSFRMVCHQIPERSFFIAGHQLAICSRCTGLYVGFTVTILAYPLIRSLRTTVAPRARWLLLAAIPMAVDFGLTFLGVWENTHTSRLLTGLLLGSATVFYVMPGIAELSLHQVRKSRSEPGYTISSAEVIAAAPSDYSAPERRI